MVSFFEAFFPVPGDNTVFLFLLNSKQPTDGSLCHDSHLPQLLPLFITINSKLEEEEEIKNVIEQAAFLTVLALIISYTADKYV